MGEYFQRTYVGGMDLISKDTDIAVNAYRYMYNARQRYGKARAIYRSKNITNNLSGQVQGLYAVGGIWIAFVSGRAFYMPVNGTTWFRVPFLQLDSKVKYIYAVAVPGSTNNYLRQGVVSTQTGTVNANAGIIQTPFTLSGTPSGLICQDGINQPWIISYDAANNNATARILGTYDQWDNTGQSGNNQEYVPVGTIMMYLAPILYIVGAGINNNVVYRSVSGAPLNFVVNVDVDGNKAPTEALGGALTTSFAQDFDPITALYPSTTTANTFILATNRNIYGLTPDLTSTIFGEPTFDKAFQILSGQANQFSACDINGDTAFIDLKGVKSFNGVQQTKFFGRNDPFSKNISNILQPSPNQFIFQTSPCCIEFNDEALFSLETTIGNVLAVYDLINKVWVGFDITEATVGGIFMFGEADYLDQSYLAAATLTGEIWQLFADTTATECGVIKHRGLVTGTYFYGTWLPGSLRDEHKTICFKCEVTNNLLAGVMTCFEFADEQRGQILNKNIQAVTQGINYPVCPPVIPSNIPRNQNLVYAMNEGITCYKIQPILQWTGDCDVEQLQLVSTTVTRDESQREGEKVFTGNMSAPLPAIQ